MLLGHLLNLIFIIYFPTPYNKELRNKYLEEVLPDFQHIQKIKEYRDLLD